MAKFYGNVGFSTTKENKPGVWKPVITERPYRGDVVRNLSVNVKSSDSTNDDVILSNQISIVADPFAHEHVYAMKYVEHLGVKWKITNAEVLYPRIILTTGDVYNGEGTAT